MYEYKGVEVKVGYGISDNNNDNNSIIGNSFHTQNFTYTHKYIDTL